MRPVEGGEREGDRCIHGGQAPVLVQMRNLVALGKGSRDASELGETEQEKQSTQAAIGDPEPEKSHGGPSMTSQLPSGDGNGA